MKNRKTVLLILIATVAIFAIVAIIYNNSQTSKTEALSFSGANEAPFTREHSVRFGGNSKNVTIVEFLDPLCGACATFHYAIKNIMSDYGDMVELVIRYMPNHSNSPNVVKILEASRIQDRYKETLDIIFASQNEWGKHNDPKPHLIWNYLQRVDGLDVEKLRVDMRDEKIEKIIELDLEDAKSLGVRGTPTIFVNKKRLDRLTYEDFDKLVLEEISR